VSFRDWWEQDDDFSLKSPIAGSAKPVVANVVDGDTLDIKMDDGSERTRVLGIDTQETVHPTKPEGPYGAPAATRMRQLAPEGQPVQTVPGYEDKDAYGRNLRYVSAINDNEDPLDIGLQMVREGLAELTSWDHPRKMEYVMALQEAMKMQVGMWSSQKIQEGMSPVEVNHEIAQKGGFGLWWELGAIEEQEKQRYGLGDLALDPTTIDAIWTNNYRREKLDELGVSPDELEGPSGLDLYFPNQEEDLNEFVRAHQNLLTGVGSAQLAREQAEMTELAAQAMPINMPGALEMQDEANALKAEANEEPGRMAELVERMGGLGPEFAGQLGTGLPPEEEQVSPETVGALGRTSFRALERLGELPENISTAMQPTGEVNPFVAAKAGLPLSPGDPKAKAEATEAGFEAVATLGGPFSAAVGDVARGAGVSPAGALALEVGAGLIGGGLATSQLAKLGRRGVEATADIATTTSMRKAVTEMMDATDAPAREAVEQVAQKHFDDLADIDLADDAAELRRAEDALNERIRQGTSLEEQLAEPGSEEILRRLQEAPTERAEAVAYNDIVNVDEAGEIIRRGGFEELMAESDPNVAKKIREYMRLSVRVSKAEKSSPIPNQAYENLGPNYTWQEFSRMRGYTEAEIDEFGRYIKLHDELKEAGHEGLINDIWRYSNEIAEESGGSPGVLRFEDESFEAISRLNKKMGIAPPDPRDFDPPDRVTHVVDEWHKRNKDVFDDVIKTGTQGLEDTKSAAGRWFNFHQPRVTELLEKGDFAGAWRYMDKLNNPLGRSKITGGLMRQDFVDEILFPSMTSQQKKAFFIGRAAAMGIDVDSPLKPADLARFEKELGAQRSLWDKLKEEGGFVGGGRRAGTEFDVEEARAMARKDLTPEEQTGWGRELQPVKNVLDKFGERFPQAVEVKNWMQRAKDLEERYIGHRIKRVVELTENVRQRSAYLARGRFRRTGIKDAAGFQDEVLRVFGNVDEKNFSKLLADTPEAWKPMFQELHELATQKIVGYQTNIGMDSKRFARLRGLVKESMHSKGDGIAGLQGFMIETIEKVSRESWNPKIVSELEDVIQMGATNRNSLIRKGLKPDRHSPVPYISESEEKWLGLLKQALKESGSSSQVHQKIRTWMALTKLPMVAVANIPQVGHTLLRSRMTSMAEAMWRLHAPDWAGGARRNVRIRGIMDAAGIDSVFNEVQELLAGAEKGTRTANIVGKYYRLEPMERWLRTLANETAIIDQSKHLRKARKMAQASDGHSLMKWSMGANKGEMTFRQGLARGKAVNFARDLKDVAGIDTMKKFEALGKASDEDFVKLIEELRAGGKMPTARKIFGDRDLETLRNASRRFIEATQFRVGLEQLPLQFNAPGKWRDWVRTVSQFRTFQYKHFQEVVHDYVWLEAKKGNVIPLAKFLLVGGVFSQITGEIVNDLKAYVMGWDRPGGNPIQVVVDRLFGNITHEQAQRQFKEMMRPDYLLERALDNFTAWGGFGIASDALSSSTRFDQLASFAGGPGLTSVVRGVIAGGKAASAGINRVYSEMQSEAHQRKAQEGLESAGIQLAKTGLKELPVGIGKSLGRRLPGSRDVEEFSAPLIEQAVSQARGGEENVARGLARSAAIEKAEAEIQAGRIAKDEEELTPQKEKMKSSLEAEYQKFFEKGDKRGMEHVEKKARHFKVDIEKTPKQRAQAKLSRQTRAARKATLKSDFIEAYRRKDSAGMNKAAAQWSKYKLGKMPTREWVRNEQP
jgi:endonuclease YncB( thermonuclease family)/predicted transcriptional regulator